MLKLYISQRKIILKGPGRSELSRVNLEEFSSEYYHVVNLCPCDNRTERRQTQVAWLKEVHQNPKKTWNEGRRYWKQIGVQKKIAVVTDLTRKNQGERKGYSQKKNSKECKSIGEKERTLEVNNVV